MLSFFLKLVFDTKKKKKFNNPLLKRREKKRECHEKKKKCELFLIYYSLFFQLLFLSFFFYFCFLRKFFPFSKQFPFSSFFLLLTLISSIFVFSVDFNPNSVDSEGGYKRQLKEIFPSVDWRQPVGPCRLKWKVVLSKSKQKKKILTGVAQALRHKVFSWKATKEYTNPLEITPKFNCRGMWNSSLEGKLTVQIK